MDIVSHGAWAFLACEFYKSRRPLPASSVRWTVVLAVAPDLVQLVPVIGAALLTSQGWEEMRAYFQALPAYRPVLPPITEALLHHLHCAAHSAILAAMVTLSIWLRLRIFWIPLAGWWSHILIDVFTHSADFYASPVFYPISQKGFDGIAWNTPWFLAANYGALAIAVVCLAALRKKTWPFKSRHH